MASALFPAHAVPEQGLTWTNSTERTVWRVHRPHWTIPVELPVCVHRDRVGQLPPRWKFEEDCVFGWYGWLCEYSRGDLVKEASSVLFRSGTVQGAISPRIAWTALPFHQDALSAPTHPLRSLHNAPTPPNIYNHRPPLRSAPYQSMGCSILVHDIPRCTATRCEYPGRVRKS